MLYLNRKPGDAVIINKTIEVKVIEIRGKTVKLGFDFPPEASVLRAEVIDEIKEANRKAIDAVQGIGDLGNPKAKAAVVASKKSTRAV
ncbi:MAG: carbon storage regulator [Geminicoccaceae bacterium]